ncbi:MAG: pitrilysin family protein [Bacteroidia bacterium]|nr:pitrilysin family protein [Bacteroidia bacterium]
MNKQFKKIWSSLPLLPVLALLILPAPNTAKANKNNTPVELNIAFEEYELPNGLHVILHQDKSVPVVVTSVMYHVGAKNESPDRTGFAHFFEHLLFEGTKNIKRGEWDKIVDENGGTGNASTSNDRTYYFLTFPSNNEELALWMEAERMRHAVINQTGVDTQREVIKEEKRYTMDNMPYGNMFPVLQQHLFTQHPYRWSTIGSMEHLDKATLAEFRNFYKKFYVPNNATLVIAGNINPAQTKEWVEKYFGSISKGDAVVQPAVKEEPITTGGQFKTTDRNIDIPAYMFAYRTPSKKEKDAYVLDMIAAHLSSGKSNTLYKELINTGNAIEFSVINESFEDYGIFLYYVLPIGQSSKQSVEKTFDVEIQRLQNNLISEEEYQKLQNQLAANFVNSLSSMENIAESLATYRVLYGNTNLINEVVKKYRSITREDIQAVAKKYLNPNQRIVIDYLPADRN